MDNESPVTKCHLGRNNIFLMQPANWKRVRTVITPAFTTGKLKGLIPTFNACTNDLCSVIEREFVAKGRDVPLKDLCGRMALSQIAKAGFSLDVDVYGDIDSQQRREQMADRYEEKLSESELFVKNARTAFKDVMVTWKNILFGLCPVTISLFERLTAIDIFSTPPQLYFRDFLSRLYDQRKRQQETTQSIPSLTPIDLFQLLMDSVDEEEEGETVAAIAAEDADIVDSGWWGSVRQDRKKKVISKMELLSQSFVLLVAGFDTTGSAMHFLIYLLALHPEVQDRLREEIVEVAGPWEDGAGAFGLFLNFLKNFKTQIPTLSGDITYDHTARMHYLEAVIMETLRLYPIAPRTSRECTSPITVGGIAFTEGQMVGVPIYAIHHDERYYPQPEEFHPERFLPEARAARDPLTYLPFGVGPRNCIGKRFAEFEIRVAMAVLFRRLKFEKVEGTPELPLRCISHGETNFLRPADTLCVRAERV